MEDGRSHIGKTTVFHLCAVVICYIDKWNRVERVRGVWCTVGIDCVIGIAMVGNDDSLITRFLHGVDDLTNAIVHGKNGLGDGIVNARMSYHIAIGEVDNDEIIFILLDSSDQLVFHFISTHLRLQVVSGNLWRRHKNTVLTLIRLFTTAIEEERYVCVLLGLSRMKLFFALFAQELAQRILYIIFREEDVHALE